MTGNQNNVGVGLGHAGGDRADAGAGNEFHADLGARVNFLQVKDQLGEILNRVDVVVRRGRNQGHAGHAEAQPGDERSHLGAGQLAALAGLGALGHLDLDFLGRGQVGRGDAEATGGDLLDRGVGVVAVGADVETVGIFAAFAGIGFAADAVHGDGEGLVHLGGKRAQRHAGGGEALADVLDRFDLVEGDRGGGGEADF